MHHNSPQSDDSWESDAVWKLLDQAPPQSASRRFADETVRAARLLEEPAAWWKRLFSPAPLTGFTVATAAIAFALVPLFKPAPVSVAPVSVAMNSPQAVAIQDIAETETLIAAVDQLDDFSDNELVSLIGF